MKKLRFIYYLWVILFFIPNLLVAQKQRPKAQNQIMDIRAKSIPAENNQQLLKDYLQLGEAFSLKTKFENKKGDVIRYQLQYDGYDIRNQQLITHSNDGTLKRLIASDLDKINIIESSPQIKQEAAIKILAKEIADHEPYLGEGRSAPKVKTVYYSKLKKDFELCYEIYMKTATEPFQYLAYVHATTGEIVSMKEAFHSCNSPGTATTVFSGNQTIITDDISGNGTDFILHDCTPVGNGAIRTRDLGSGEDFGVFTEFHDDFNNWDPLELKDQFALDAHFGTEATHAYCMTNVGFDITNGTELVSGLTDGFLRDNNAGYFPGRDEVIYGRWVENSVIQGYMTALDIVAHELGHAVTFYNSNLVFAGESGALNEAFSDILGNVVQAEYGPVNWTLGEDIESIRSMEEPNDFGHPDTYEGPLWDSNADIHELSGVANHWFYLLTEGGSNINGLMEPYEVEGLGLATAVEIAIHVWMNFLVDDSNYHDFENAAIAAAIDLYGECSDEHISVTNALHAVGLGAPFNATEAITQLVADPITNCSAFLSWEDNGANSYSLHYRELNNGIWSIVHNILVPEYILSDLDEDTQYVWYVTNACVAPGTSAVFNYFSTIDECPIVDLINVVDISSCSATLDWDNYGAENYEVFYRIATIPGPFIPVTTNTSDILLVDLEAGTTYEVFIITNCSENCSSLESALIEFTTDGCAPNNTGSIFNISACQATFVFDPVPGETYEVSWQFDINGNTSFRRGILPGENQITINNPGSLPSVTFTLITLCEGPGCEIRILSNPVTGIFPNPNPTNNCEAPTNVTASVELINNEYFWTVNFDQSGDYDFHEVRYGNSSTGFSVTRNTGNLTYTGRMPNGILCLEIEVRTICECDAPGLASDWVSIAQPLCIPCDPPQEMLIADLCNESVQLDFVLPQSAIGFDVRYRPSGTIPWVNTISLGNFNTSLELINLMPSTTYEVQTRSECGSNPATFSDWTTFLFTTSGICPMPTGLTATVLNATTANIFWDPVPNADYYEISYHADGSTIEFSGILTGNSFELTNVDLTQGYWVKVKSICTTCEESDWTQEIFVIFNDCVVDESLVSVVTNANAALITPAGGSQEVFQIIYRETGTSSWTNIGTTIATEVEISNLDPCTEYEFQLRILCNGVWSPFSNTMTFTTFCCEVDENLISVIVDENSAIVTPAGGDQVVFQVIYRVVGTSGWTNTGTTDATDVDLLNLDACTEYQFRLRIRCVDGNWSPWSSPMTFTTLCCEVDDNLISVVVDVNSAVVTPAGGDQVVFQVIYREVGTSGWTNTGTTNATDVELLNLEPCTQYQFRLRIRCAAGNWTSWSSPMTFTTLCNPCDLDLSNMYTNVNFSYIYIYPFGGQVRTFNYRWKIAGSSTWMTVTNNNSHFIYLTGLDDCTEYEFEVQEICPNGNTSDWSSTNTETTLCCVVDLSNLTSTSELKYIHVYPFNFQVGTFNYRWREAGSSNWTTINNRNSHFFLLENLDDCTDYEFEVQMICQGGTTSDWSATHTVTTLCCEIDISNLILNVFDTYVAIYPYGFASGNFQIQWRETGTTDWTDNSVVINSNVDNIVGLELCKKYEFRVRERCAPNCFSEWSTITTFAMECCDAPKKPSFYFRCSFNILGAQSLELEGILHQNRYRVWGSNDAWTVMDPTTDGSQELGVIPDCEAWEFQVRRECVLSNGNVIWSPWSELRIFEGRAHWLPATQITVTGQGTNTIEICIDNNTNGTIEFQWEVNPNGIPYSNIVVLLPNTLNCISVPVEEGDELCYRHQRTSPLCPTKSCWNSRCINITVDEEECDGCDVIYMMDESNTMDDDQNEDVQCRIKKDMEDISERCPDCDSKFAVTKFGGTKNQEMVVPFDCDPIEDFGDDLNTSSTNVGAAIGQLYSWLENGDLGATDSDCLKVKIYSNANCSELTAPVTIGTMQYSFQEAINLLNEMFGAEVCILHYPEYDKAGNQINSLGECEGLGEVPVLPVTPECEEDMPEPFKGGIAITNAQEEVRAFPNPFDQAVNFEINLNNESSVRLEIFNTLGEKVIQRVVDKVDIGLYKMQINEALPTGTYFYQITFDEQTRSGKLIKI